MFFLLLIFGHPRLYAEFTQPGAVVPASSRNLLGARALCHHLLPVNLAGILLDLDCRDAVLLEAKYTSMEFCWLAASCAWFLARSF